MEELIGMSLDECKKVLQSKGINFVVQNNNHKVSGDTVLVTNAKTTADNTVILTIGEFIFNLKD